MYIIYRYYLRLYICRKLCYFRISCSYIILNNKRISWSLKIKLICIILLIINLHLLSFWKDILENLIVIHYNKSTITLLSDQLATKVSVTMCTAYNNMTLHAHTHTSESDTVCASWFNHFIRSSLALHVDFSSGK